MKHLALLAMLWVGSAQAETPTLEGATTGWSQAQRSLAQKALDTLASAGVNPASGIDRMQEWQAKGADSARALLLLEAFAAAAVEGRDAVTRAGVASSALLVEAAATARQAGVGGEELSRLLHGSSSADEAHGRCLAVTTLTTAGFAPSGAAEMVHLAAERGYGNSDLASMVASAQRLVREGAAPRPALLNELGSALRRGLRPGELYPAVVQALSGAPRPSPEAGFNHPVLRNPR